ncbi:MAG: hypothetical protein ABW046_16380 [Actinoplanes sp.]
MSVHDHSTRSFADPTGAPYASRTDAYPPGPAAVGGDGAPPTWTPPSGDAGKPGAGGRKNPKVAVAGALVAVAVASAGITAGVMAATGGDSTSASAAGPGGGGQGPGMGGRGGTMGGGGGAAAALHGEYVVSDGNGGYATQLTQTGTVSAVSSSSITVKSTDGFSQTYVITSVTSVDNGQDQIADVVTGHTVRVVATSADSTATATTITDSDLASTTQQQSGGQPGGGAPGAGGPADQQGGAGT